MSTSNIYDFKSQYSSDYNYRKCRQIVRIIKHLKDQIPPMEQGKMQLPSDWLIEQLVSNAFCHTHENLNTDWQTTIYQTLKTITNNLHQFYIFDAKDTIVEFCASQKHQKLFPNDENLSPYQIKAFTLRLLSLIDHKESQFK